MCNDTQLKALLTSSISTLEFSNTQSMQLHIVRGLNTQGIVTIGDLVALSEVDILKIPNFGIRNRNLIKGVLEARGLHLGMSVEGREVSLQKEALFKEALTAYQEQASSLINDVAEHFFKLGCAAQQKLDSKR